MTEIYPIKLIIAEDAYNAAYLDDTGYSICYTLFVMQHYGAAYNGLYSVVSNLYSP